MALQIFKVPEYPDHLGMEGKPAAVTPWSSYISKTRIKPQNIKDLLFALSICGPSEAICVTLTSHQFGKEK